MDLREIINESACAVYRSGPNIFIGAAGVTVEGLSVLACKVTKTALEKQFSVSTSPIERNHLQKRIKSIEKAEKEALNQLSSWGLSMIPIFGPDIADQAIKEWAKSNKEKQD